MSTVREVVLRLLASDPKYGSKQLIREIWAACRIPDANTNQRVIDEGSLCTPAISADEPLILVGAVKQYFSGVIESKMALYEPLKITAHTAVLVTCE